MFRLGIENSIGILKLGFGIEISNTDPELRFSSQSKNTI